MVTTCPECGEPLVAGDGKEKENEPSQLPE